jgi:hypothetical protein
MRGDTAMKDVEKEIVRLEEELSQTEHRLDVEALNSVYADDIIVNALRLIEGLEGLDRWWRARAVDR